MKKFEEHLTREIKRSCLRDEQWRIERDRRRTREEKRMRRLTITLDSILVALFVIATALMACTEAGSSVDPYMGYTPEKTCEEPAQEGIPTVYPEELDDCPVDVVAQEPLTYEDHFREVAKKVEDCKLTHYCTELYPHICGTGDGLTAKGGPVIAYHTCAVDPSVIPYGAEVMVDYGDEVQFWKAQDCGAWVKGNHIDLAVTTHTEADELGIKYATVYWAMPEDLDERF